MKLLDRFLEIFGWRRKAFLGAVDHPNDLMAYIHAIRARAFLKITGKSLTSPKLTSNPTPENMTDQISPLRRLSRRYVD